MRRKKVFRGLICLFAALLAFFIFGRLIALEYRSDIDGALGTVSSEVVTPEDEDTDTADLYSYKSEYKSSDEMIQSDVDLGTRIGEEGAVLLKNENDALPISKNDGVSIFGIAAYNSELGGAVGSECADNSRVGYPKVNFVDAIEEKGVGVNPDLEEAYKTLNRSVTGVSGGGGGWMQQNTTVYTWSSNEATTSDLEETKSGCTSNSDYSDAAIVVLGRRSSEGNNMNPGTNPDAVNASDFTLSDNKNPLSLCDQEKDIIATAKSSADKLIVVLNANNPLELTELNEKGGDYEADAILWVGTTGAYGMKGVANVIVGDASPSGKTVDTFASNSALAPAAINQGCYCYDNYDIIAIDDGTNYMGYTYTNGQGEARNSLYAAYYEVEAEGIYTGYKYYETRYYDSVVSDNNLGDHNGAVSSTGTNAQGWNYDDEVCYSFGYGLSYASFTQKLDSVSVDKNNETVTAQITVTRNENDGYSGAARDVVELYVQSPYTQYDVDNNVEKSAIQLLDYGKTEPLKAGEYETITLTADMKYMASYDYTNAETYILDDGDYYFAIGNGSHDALNNVMKAQGVEGVSGDAAKAATWSNSRFDSSTFSTAENGAKITNQLEDADVNYWLPGTCTYLSRSDWDGTWPIEYSGDNALSVATETEDGGAMLKQLRNRTYEVQDNDMITTTWGEDNGLTIAALKDADFDDERWDFLIEQITIEEAIDMNERGGGSTRTMASIQNPECAQSDGPHGLAVSMPSDHTVVTEAEDVDDAVLEITGDKNSGYSFGTMSCACLKAATFSKEIATLIGEHYGEEGLWTGRSQLWGSCGQLHRNAYCGRAHEYYSEDGVLTGLTNQCVVEGSRTKGLLLGPKHFAFNTTETNRAGLCTFFNEQAGRENELRGFQGGFEDGGALGLMGGFNRVGITFCNAHTGLYQGILREEWGFKGLTSTDMCDKPYYMCPAECILAGTTMMANSSESYLGSGTVWEYADAENVANDSALLEQLQMNMKYQWYAYANSNAMNGMNQNSYIVTHVTWWDGLLISGIVIFAVLLAAFVVLYVVFEIRDKRNEGGNKQ